jgi:TrmH family RNA methyltransferase
LQIFAATAGGTSITELTAEQIGAPTAWVFGNEAQGVSDEWLELADHAVALPMYGRAESLNIAAAAAVCLYSSAFAQNTNR